MSTAGIELSVIEDEGGDIKVVDENNETDVPRKSKSLQARHRNSTPEMLEKLHELMVPADESYRTVDTGDRYVIEPEGEAAGKYTRQSTSKLVKEGFDYNSGDNG